MKRIPPTGRLSPLACARVFRFIYDLLREEFAYRRDFEEMVFHWLFTMFPNDFPECYNEKTDEIYGEKEVENHE